MAEDQGRQLGEDDYCSLRTTTPDCKHLTASTSAEEESESEQQQCEEESDASTSDNHLFPIPNILRTKETDYSDVVMKKDDSLSGALFQLDEDTSLDSQPPTIYSQGTQQTLPLHATTTTLGDPQARPADSFSASKKPGYYSGRGYLKELPRTQRRRIEREIRKGRKPGEETNFDYVKYGLN